MSGGTGRFHSEDGVERKLDQPGSAPPGWVPMTSLPRTSSSHSEFALIGDVLSNGLGFRHATGHTRWIPDVVVEARLCLVHYER